MDDSNFEMKKKSFWQRPEGVTGMIFLTGLAIGGGYLIYALWPILIGAFSNILTLTALLLALGAILYVVLDWNFHSYLVFKLDCWESLFCRHLVFLDYLQYSVVVLQ